MLRYVSVERIERCRSDRNNAMLVVFVMMTIMIVDLVVGYSLCSREQKIVDS